MFIQGRELKTSEIEWIRGLLQVHPEWNRIRLSRDLYGGWYWRNLAGWPKDTAACTLLLKIKLACCIALPGRRRLRLMRAAISTLADINS
jgi:hypothetical protein